MNPTDGAQANSNNGRLRGLLALPIRHPLLCLAVVLAGLVPFALALPDFEVESSTDSTVLQDDPDLIYYDATRNDFTSDEYVIVAFPTRDPVSMETVEFVESLADQLLKIDGIASVLALTRPPVVLFQNRRIRLPFAPPMLLTDPKVDRERALKELTTHAVWSNNLISSDGKAVALIANFDKDPDLKEAENRYHGLRGEPPSEERDRALAEAREKFRPLDLKRRELRTRIVESIHELVQKHSTPQRPLYAAGVPVVVTEIVRYLKRDLLLFGGVSAAVFLLILAVIFRTPRWVLLPMAPCLGTVVAVLGIMALMDKRATVITSNISSLLFLIAMAHSVHLIVRYQEARADQPAKPRCEALASAVRAIWVPCFYTAATTCVGFLSLWVSNIRPVMDFGFYMAGGVGLALLLSFVFFPAGVTLLRARPQARLRRPGALRAPEEQPEQEDGEVPRPSPTLSRLAQLALRRWKTIILLSVALAVAGVLGLVRIEVETTFIDYFREGTFIREGLGFVDREVGGTTSLEVMLDGGEAGAFGRSENLKRLAKLHKYLEDNPAVGKVLSAHSFLIEARKMDPRTARKGRAVLYEKMVDTIGREALNGYVTPDDRKARVFARIKDTAPRVQRLELLGHLREYVKEPEFQNLSPRVTGVFVLYTNMLGTLVDSQVNTIALVFVAIGGMMFLLLRSLKAAIVGMIPNILPIFLVLGTMGWTKIHLDMATVMTAAVSLGMAVDGTIHYLHRYRKERRKGLSAEEAVTRSHASIGRAIFYTYISVLGGFLALILSVFRPTAYFGLFTSVSMAAAIFGTLTLLPVLVVKTDLFGGARSRGA